MASCTLSLTPVNGELRIYDLHIAERLGFSQAFDIRKIIKRYEAKLLNFGVLATVAKTSGALGGRPTNEYYLNQKQAIFVCMKSETDKAADVQVEIVHVFDAYLNGALQIQPQPAQSVYHPASPQLNANDQHNIQRIIWMMARWMRFESSLSYATWYALRQATGCPSPNRFEVRHLPVIAAELRRILEIAVAYQAHQTTMEKELIRRAIRSREIPSIVIGQMREIEAEWLNESKPWRAQLDDWHRDHLDTLATRGAAVAVDHREYAEPALV